MIPYTPPTSTPIAFTHAQAGRPVDELFQFYALEGFRGGRRSCVISFGGAEPSTPGCDLLVAGRRTVVQ